MNWLFFNLIIIGILQQTSSAALSSENEISLYNANDKITILNSQNFSSTVYQSKTAWLIEFYISWCGHCQSYANNYREIAIDALGWKRIVRIGAINCYTRKDTELCRQHSVRRYPTLLFIPPATIFNNKSKVITIRATGAKEVERELIKDLENVNQRNISWPRFTPANRATFEELYTRLPKTTKLFLIIAEKRDDFTGRQIMLDFSKYHEQITIFRTTTDGKLWRKFNGSTTDVPALFVVHRNRTVERINTKQNISNTFGNRNLFNYAIRSYIHKTKCINNFDDHDLEEIIRSRNALKTAEVNQKLVQNQNITDDIRDKHTVYRKVNMIDLELALSFMFRQEIPQMEDIQGETYEALVQWLTVLTKYFPGRAPVMAYLKQLLSKIKEQTNGFSGNKFREIIDMKTSNAYLPNDHEQYQYCVGSAPQYRGYPCALWLLFHTLTVSQYKKESNQINVIEIPLAIKNYIKYFFSCRQCSENFMKETMDINQLNSTNKYQGIIYLWKIHNHINKRLRDDITEDPEHPKVQFPSKYLCKTCQSMNNSEYDTLNTFNFLLKYYSKENINTSLLLKKSLHNINLLNRSDYILSNMKYDHEITQQFGLFQSVLTILQHFQLYIIIGFMIIVVLFRRQYCKSKRKRYIL